MIRLTDDEGADWEFVDYAQFQDMVKKHSINLETSVIRFRVKVPGQHLKELVEVITGKGGKLL